MLAATLRTMPFWLFSCWRPIDQMRRLDDAFTFPAWAMERTSPLRSSASQNPDLASNQHPQVGDGVAILRGGQQPAIVALGVIAQLNEPTESFLGSAATCEILPTSTHFDNPIMWGHLRSVPGFGRVVKTSASHLTRGARIPMRLSHQQWEILQLAVTKSPSPAPSWLQWKIGVGDEISRTELHDSYGGSSTSRSISPSGRKPHIFVFSSSAARHIASTGATDGSLVITVPGQHIDGFVHHLREGRAIRLFEQMIGDQSRVRYCGQYMVDSHDPVITAEIRHPGYVGMQLEDWAKVRVVPVGPTKHFAHHPAPNIGHPYRVVAEDILVSEGRPGAADPALHTRANRAHRLLQNNLAEKLRSFGLVPLSPGRTDPQFDIAAVIGQALVIAEVKSVTEANFHDQALAGFSQACFYSEHYERTGQTTVPLVYLERAPTASIYRTMAKRREVVLGDPQCINDILSVIVRDYARLP